MIHLNRIVNGGAMISYQDYDGEPVFAYMPGTKELDDYCCSTTIVCDDEEEAVFVISSRGYVVDGV